MILFNETPKYDTYRFYEGVFTPEECDLIIPMMTNPIPSSIHKIQAPDVTLESDIRFSEHTWIDCNPETSWMFERLFSIVTDVNKAFWNFQLTGFVEPLQLVRYPVGGHYTWHQDNGSGYLGKRKLSLSVQLTDPKDYEGGELEILLADNPPPRTRGTVVVFPSYQVHRVNPVTSGVRHALVTWIHGESYR
jgi:PKHD-type hydroxylase